MTGIAPWVIEHWLSYWFSVRHTGDGGHEADACKRHARHYLGMAKAIR